MVAFYYCFTCSGGIFCKKSSKSSGINHQQMTNNTQNNNGQGWPLDSEVIAHINDLSQSARNEIDRLKTEIKNAADRLKAGESSEEIAKHLKNVINGGY